MGGLNSRRIPPVHEGDLGVEPLAQSRVSVSSPLIQDGGVVLIFSAYIERKLRYILQILTYVCGSFYAFQECTVIPQRQCARHDLLLRGHVNRNTNST